MSITQSLAAYSVNLKYSDLPTEVVEMAKKMTIQTVGAALASREMEFTQSVIDFSKRAYGAGNDATLMLDGSKTSLLGAAFANSTVADNIDWEDCSCTGHPSASLIPVSLAICEARGLSGKEYIEGVIAGFEVYQRIARAIQPPEGHDNRKGWGLTSWQIYAAAAPAAKLLKLDAKKTEQTYGIAAVLTATPSNIVHGTMSNVYHYQHGFCSHDGLIGALLAEHGVDGMQDAFDGPFSYGTNLTVEHKTDWYLKELGSRYLILETLLKHWPTNMWVQTSLDIMDSLIKEHKFGPDDVEEIIVDPPTQSRMMCYPEGFEKIIEAQYSIPFCIAALLCDPTPGPQWYTEKNMKDPKVLATAAKVKGSDAEPQLLMDSFSNFRKGEFASKTITVKLKDGRTVSKGIDYPKGHPKNMLTVDEVCDRFRIQAAHTLSSDRVEEVLSALLHIEDMTSLADVGKLLH